jgi:F-type H+-transporting ATPase subunit gamma
MPSGKEIKSRIKSVKNTGKITKAMELISTVKMKKAQESLFGVRPFATAALKVFSRITRDASTFALYAEAPVADTELIIMVASQKGLCGGYNATVYKKTTEYVRDDYGPGPDTKKYDYITIGKRARDFVLRTGQHLVADFSDEIKDPFTILENRQVVRFIVNEWKSGKYSKISVVYNHYISAITQQAVVRTLFPIVPIDIVDFLESVI